MTYTSGKKGVMAALNLGANTMVEIHYIDPNTKTINREKEKMSEEN